MSEVAAAFVTIAPSAKGFGSLLERQIGPDLDKTGKKVGSTFGHNMKLGMTSVGVTAGVSSARLFRVGPEEHA